MARLHSKKHGKSGSKKPANKTSPEWVGYSAHEVEDLVMKLRKEGMEIAQIGQKLRDVYGVPSVRNVAGKSITKIVKASGQKLEYPEDLLSLIRRAVNVRKHLGANKQDNHNKVKLRHIESKINRLVKYYGNSGKLPDGWIYEPEKAALLVK
ncbi:30S ribosomal protein S15 [Candidatus Parvarchaeota archaeon]|nr:30S ribosomal protein S15 [Candidatus Parvarchaeota archaeon]